MDRPVGGRGIKAPYQTTHIRVPLPVKAEVEKLIDEYRESLLHDLPKQLRGLAETDDDEDLDSSDSSPETLKSQAEQIDRHALESKWLTQAVPTQKEELLFQRDRLIVQLEAIQAQQEKIQAQQEKIQAQREMIKAQWEIQAQWEEIQAQRQEMEIQNQELQSMTQEMESLYLVTSLEEAKELAKKVLACRGSASKSVAALLSAIYKAEVTAEELK